MPSVPSNGPEGPEEPSKQIDMMPEVFSMHLRIEIPDNKIDIDFGEQNREDHALGLQGVIAWLEGKADFIYAKDRTIT